MFNPNLNLGVTYKKNVKKKTNAAKVLFIVMPQIQKRIFLTLSGLKIVLTFCFNPSIFLPPMLAEMTKLFNFLSIKCLDSDAVRCALLGMEESWNILPSRYTIMYSLDLFSTKNLRTNFTFCHLKTYDLIIESTKQLKTIQR